MSTDVKDINVIGIYKCASSLLRGQYNVNVIGIYKFFVILHRRNTNVKDINDKYAEKCIIIFWQFDEQKYGKELSGEKIFPEFFLKFFNKI